MLQRNLVPRKFIHTLCANQKSLVNIPGHMKASGVSFFQQRVRDCSIQTDFANKGTRFLCNDLPLALNLVDKDLELAYFT